MNTGVRGPEEVLHCLSEASFHPLLPTPSTREAVREGAREGGKDERER